MIAELEVGTAAPHLRLLAERIHVAIEEVNADTRLGYAEVLGVLVLVGADYVAGARGEEQT